jgi:hypothetical protein
MNPPKIDSITGVQEYLGATRFNRWQLAEKGDWQNRKEISESSIEDQIAAADGWLREVGHEIAIEALFDLPKSEVTFLGVNLEKESKEIQVGLIRKFITTVLPNDDFETTASKMSQFTPAQLYLGSPTFLEVGVMNLWHDVGSQVVFRQNAGQPMAPNEIPARLQVEHPNPVMLEVAWDEPYQHWIALPVSSKTASGMFKFDELRYEAAVRAALSS